MTDNQCAFSDTFTTLQARGLSQHPADTATLVISINSNGIIAVGGLAGAVNNLTEAGQLLTSNRTQMVALDAGATSQVLTANSSAANGIRWADLPAAMPTTLGVMYGTLPTSNIDLSLSLGYGSEAPSTWSIAIGNSVLAAAESTPQCDVAVGTENLQNLTTSSFNTTIGQNSLAKIMTGGSNVAIGYSAGGGAYGFVTSGGNIAIG